MRRERLLALLATVITRHARLIVGLAVVFTLVAGGYALSNLDFKTSRNDLIGRDSEYWRLYSEYAREFAAEEDYILVVESQHPARNQAAIDALARELVAPSNTSHPRDPKLAQNFGPQDSFHRVGLESLQPWFLYYLSTNDLVEIRASLQEFNQLVTLLQQNPKLSTFFEAMTQMLQQMENAPAAERARMEAFVPTITAIVKQMANYDPAQPNSQVFSPWAGAFFSEEMVGEAEQEMKWQGYHAFKNGEMFIMLVHPRVPPGVASPDHHAATIKKIRRIMESVRAEHRDVTITLTGEPVLDTDEMVSSERDAIRSAILTIILICLIVVTGVRDWLRMLLSMTCLIMVVIASLGYATVAVGHLNIITITFAVMILGLGEDLGVQFISRFEEELSKGLDRVDAVRNALQFTTPSIVTAGVTNAAAFFAMALSGFKGVVELGIIAGGGMLLAVLGMTIVLPALILIVRRGHEPSGIPARAQATAIERGLLRNPGRTLIIAAVLTVGGLTVAWRVGFDYNVLKLQSRGLESVETELRLLGADAQSTIYAAVVADNLEECRRLQAALTNLSSVAVVHSAAEVIPENQPAKVPYVAEIRQRVGDVKFAVPEFREEDVAATVRSLRSLGLRAAQLAREGGAGNKVLENLAEAIRSAREKLANANPAHLGQYEKTFYSDLQAQLTLLATQADRPMSLDDMPEPLRRTLVGKSGKLLLRVFPRENIWERGPLERFIQQVQSVAPQVTGTPSGLYEFIAILQQGYIKAALWALLVIAVMVYLDLRGVFATCLTLLPILIGTIWMVAGMVVIGVNFNPANILTLPLIVGIGVAYGIYIVRRYREDGEPTFYGKSTGRAVMLSALTTVIAFSSLLIGAHRGIRSLGLVMAIGAAACLVASLLVLPAILEYARRRGWKV